MILLYCMSNIGAFMHFQGEGFIVIVLHYSCLMVVELLCFLGGRICNDITLFAS
jgi:hypothetical protein